VGAEGDTGPTFSPWSVANRALVTAEASVNGNSVIPRFLMIDMEALFSLAVLTKSVNQSAKRANRWFQRLDATANHFAQSVRRSFCKQGVQS